MNILVGMDTIEPMASMEIIRASAPALAPALLRAKPLRSCASAPALAPALLSAKPLRSCAPAPAPALALLRAKPLRSY